MLRSRARLIHLAKFHSLRRKRPWAKSMTIPNESALPFQEKDHTKTGHGCPRERADRFCKPWRPCCRYNPRGEPGGWPAHLMTRRKSQAASVPRNVFIAVVVGGQLAACVRPARLQEGNIASTPLMQTGTQVCISGGAPCSPSCTQNRAALAIGRLSTAGRTSIRKPLVVMVLTSRHSLTAI